MRNLIVILMVASASIALAEDDFIKVGSFTEKNISPPFELQEPLNTIVSFSFPKGIDTVGQAVELALSPSGYSLDKSFDFDLLYLMKLADSHRNMPEMRLKTLIGVLVGNGFKVNINHNLRRISFVFSGAVDDELKALAEAAKETSILPVFDETKQLRPSLNYFSSNDNSNQVSDDYYIVQPGDSVYKIALNKGISFTESFVQNVLQNNPRAFINQDPKTLIVGSKLHIR